VKQKVKERRCKPDRLILNRVPRKQRDAGDEIMLSGDPFTGGKLERKVMWRRRNEIAATMKQGKITEVRIK